MVATTIDRSLKEVRNRLVRHCLRHKAFSGQKKKARVREFADWYVGQVVDVATTYRTRCERRMKLQEKDGVRISITVTVKCPATRPEFGIPIRTHVIVRVCLFGKSIAELTSIRNGVLMPVQNPDLSPLPWGCMVYTPFHVTANQLYVWHSGTKTRRIKSWLRDCIASYEAKGKDKSIRRFRDCKPGRIVDYGDEESWETTADIVELQARIDEQARLAEENAAGPAPPVPNTETVRHMTDSEFFAMYEQMTIMSMREHFAPGND
jgi:hypothetical protein